MWRQWFNCNFTKQRKYFFVCKENKNNNLLNNYSPKSCLPPLSRVHMDCFTDVLAMFLGLGTFALLSGQRALRFHQKYLHLCSKDEQRSYRFGTTSGWVINGMIFHFCVNYPFKSLIISLYFTHILEADTRHCFATNPEMWMNLFKLFKCQQVIFFLLHLETDILVPARGVMFPTFPETFRGSGDQEQM